MPNKVQQLMSRFLRYLRIAFSATCLIACVLLIVLWVRSHWRFDIASAPIFQLTRIDYISAKGSLLVGFEDPAYSEAAIELKSFLLTDDPVAVEQFEALSASGFDFARYPGGWRVQVPHYFGILIVSVAAALPWVRSQFSLRTLLIATTLVAVALGIIVWMSRTG